MTQLINNFSTTLSGDITSGATSMGLTDATGLASASPYNPFILTLDDGTNVEIVKVTAVSGNTVTAMVRAQEGVGPFAFAAADTVVEARWTKRLAEAFGTPGALTDDTGVLTDQDGNILTVEY